MTGRLRLPVAALALSVVLSSALAGCDGGDKPAPTGRTSPDASSSGATTADLEAMHADLHEVGDLIDAAAHGAEDYQALVRTAYEKDPKGIFANASVNQALVEQEEREQARNDAIAALGESPALDDPDVAAAYEDFSTAAKKMFTFQDGYNASMTFYLRAFDVCPRIFDVNVEPDAFAGIPGHYAAQWVEEHQRLAKPCVTLTNNLARSENYQMAAYAENMQWVIRKREEAVAAQGTGLSPQRSFQRVKKANETFLKRNATLHDFSGELQKLDAIDDYHALDAVFEDRLGGASSSPS